MSRASLILVETYNLDMPDITTLIKNHTEDVEMEIKREHLVDDEPDGESLIELLQSDEQLKFLFRHEGKGLKIDRAGEEPETPYNSWSDGARYYLVTDERILFVAKQDPEPELHEIQYSDIGSVETNRGMTKSRITLFMQDGTEVSFWNMEPDYSDPVESGQVENFVKEKVQQNDTQEGPFCIECGVVLKGDEKFCPECGQDLSSSACQNCSQYLSGVENFCPSCGEEVAEG